MKNKVLTYSLLVVVAVIWYQVFFRVRNNLMGREDPVLPTNRVQTRLVSVARDTFALKASYRDPFGEGRERIPVNGSETQRTAEPIRRTPKVQHEAWPSMQYFGLVRRTESKVPLGIVKVDGYQLMVRTGDELFNGIYVNQIWRDSIQIRRGREKKVFSR